MEDGKDARRRTLATVLSQNQNIPRPHEYNEKKLHTYSQKEKKVRWQRTK